MAQLQLHATGGVYSYLPGLSVPSTAFLVSFSAQPLSDLAVNLSQGDEGPFHIVTTTEGISITYQDRNTAAPVKIAGWTGAIPQSERRMWIAWERDTGLLRVGLGAPLQNTLIEHRANRENITRIGFSSFDHQVAVTDIHVRTFRKLADQINLRETFGQFQWHADWTLPRPGNGLLLFEANTSDEVLVGFSKEARTEDPMYECSLGINGAAIRRAAQARSNDAERTAKLFDGRGEFVPFWVRVENGAVAAGHGDDQAAAVVHWNDPKPLPVRYIALTSFRAPLTLRNIFVVDVEPSHGPYSDANARRGLPIDHNVKGAAILNSQNARDYLAVTVLPTLTRGIEELLRLVDKRQHDEEEGHAVTTTFHPLIWLASYLMRNNQAKIPR